MFNSWTALVTNATKLRLSSSEKKGQILVQDPYLGTRIWVHAMIGLLKSHRWFANKVEGEIRNALPVIFGVHWEPRTRIKLPLYTVEKFMYRIMYKLCMFDSLTFTSALLSSLDILHYM